MVTFILCNYTSIKMLLLEKRKMTANSQLLTTTPKTKKQTKQTTRTVTESQKWRSHGGLSAGE